MHSLLPDDAPQVSGLMGWWTMEEGGGNYTVDVTEARFRSRLVGLGRGRGMRWVEAEEVSPRVGLSPAPPTATANACYCGCRRCPLLPASTVST